MPLSIEKLRAVSEIVVHASCADGMASALILRDVLPGANVRFIQYNTPEHRDLQPAPGMLFCDFSPHRDRTREFVEVGAIVLDHHKSQRAVVEAFGENGVYADEKEHPGVSGATLAYTEVWRLLSHPSLFGGTARFVESFAERIATYDTWQRHRTSWVKARVLTEMMHFYPFEMWPSVDVFSLRHEAMWAERARVGEILVAKKDERVQKAVDNGYYFTSAGRTRVIMFEGVTETSDAAELLDNKVDLVVGFHYSVEEGRTVQLRFSTRSHTGYDCAALAARHKGGGHTAAAGFSIKDDDPRFMCCVDVVANPFAVFEGVLTRHEDADNVKEGSHMNPITR